jgi:hypothetical protein
MLTPEDEGVIVRAVAAGMEQANATKLIPDSFGRFKIKYSS